jgi:hypothetical protein
VLTLPPDAALALVVSSGVAVVMVMKGLQARALDRKSVRCRTCGGFSGRTCTCRNR